MNRAQIMAHIAQVPISIEFAPKPRKWELCVVRLSEMPRPHPDPIVPTIPQPQPNPIGPTLPPFTMPRQVFKPLNGIALWRKINSAMLEASSASYYMVSSALMGASRLADLIEEHSLGTSDDFKILVSFPREAKPTPLRDPWQMRQEFLSLRQSTPNLRAFLNRWGRWSGEGLNQYPFVPKNLGDEGIEYVIPQDAWRLQASYKAGLAGDAALWLSVSGRIPTPTRRATAPFLATRDELCTAAIETTITMDKLADAPYRLCARSDCGTVFKVESNHSRAYCSQPCAHLVSVRKGREAKRQAKTKGSKGQ